MDELGQVIRVLFLVRRTHLQLSILAGYLALENSPIHGEPLFVGPSTVWEAKSANASNPFVIYFLPLEVNQV